MHEAREDISEEEQWAKINTDRKRSLYMRIVLKNHTPSSAWVTAELNIHLEDHFHKNCLT
jgi:hypothetical protein